MSFNSIIVASFKIKRTLAYKCLSNELMYFTRLIGVAFTQVNAKISTVSHDQLQETPGGTLTRQTEYTTLIRDLVKALIADNRQPGLHREHQHFKDPPQLPDCAYTVSPMKVLKWMTCYRCGVRWQSLGDADLCLVCYFDDPRMLAPCKEDESTVSSMSGENFDVCPRCNIMRLLPVMGPCPFCEYDRQIAQTVLGTGIPAEEWHKPPEETTVEVGPLLTPEQEATVQKLGITRNAPRIGDPERNHNLMRLEQAFVDGYLDQETYGVRCDAALAAKTQAELDLLVHDLRNVREKAAVLPGLTRVEIVRTQQSEQLSGRQKAVRSCAVMLDIAASAAFSPIASSFGYSLWALTAALPLLVVIIVLTAKIGDWTIGKRAS
jgi:hypothetical protein